MTLSNSCSSIRVEIDLSEPFDTLQDFIQSDPLSCLFNFVMENALRKEVVHRNGTMFQKSVPFLAYTDDLDIIGHTNREVPAAFGAIERESTKMGLAVNEVETCYILILRLRPILHFYYTQGIYLSLLNR